MYKVKTPKIQGKGGENMIIDKGLREVDNLCSYMEYGTGRVAVTYILIFCNYFNC